MMTPKTSESHPIQIATIQIKTTPIRSRLGITFCPGKKDPSAMSGAWDRDLNLDLDRIEDWGATTIVTLLQSEELKLLKVEALPNKINARGLRWVHMPIEDVSVPTGHFEQLWRQNRVALLNTLRSGGNLLVHCRGGLGRAGLVAARLLIELGYEPKDAINTVREHRRGAIETRAQEEYVKTHQPPQQPTNADWFEKITGTLESTYDLTQSELMAKDGFLYSSGRCTGYRVGSFESMSLGDIRKKIPFSALSREKSTVRVVQGDIKDFHSRREHNMSLFQVASQFNCLEMINPSITPEHGVTRYANDLTQGPACSISAGAATIYRNYLIPRNGILGQTKTSQIDCSQVLRRRLASDMEVEASELWSTQNGYAFFTDKGLKMLREHLNRCNQKQIDQYSELLEIGVHRDCSVTLEHAPQNQLVSQVFCSALPISYNQVRESNLADWKPIAQLILNASYKATLMQAVVNKITTGNATVFLTLVGGGAFGNPKEWIYDAMLDAIKLVSSADLDIRIVSFQKPDPDLVARLQDVC